MCCWPPVVRGYELIGYNKPCYEVGGDYFDYLLRDDQTLSFAVGDVSGKGLSAALLMASGDTFAAPTVTDGS